MLDKHSVLSMALLIVDKIFGFTGMTLPPDIVDIVSSTYMKKGCARTQHIVSFVVKIFMASKYVLAAYSHGCEADLRLQIGNATSSSIC